MQARVARLQVQQEGLERVCGHCGGGGGATGASAAAVADVEESHIVCASLDCGVYYERVKTRNELQNMRALAAAALELLEKDA